MKKKFCEVQGKGAFQYIFGATNKALYKLLKNIDIKPRSTNVSVEALLSLYVKIPSWQKQGILKKKKVDLSSEIKIVVNSGNS